MSWFNQLRDRLNGASLAGIWQETKWIYRYVRRYRGAICLFVLLSLGGTALGLGSTVASKHFFDLIETHLRGLPTTTRQILLAGGLCVALAVANILLSSLIKWFSAKINVSVSNEIRADIYQKFLMTDLESLQAFHSGDLLSRINTDVTSVAESVLGWIPTLVVRLVQFVASLGIILAYDPTMAIFALLSAPFTLLASRYLMGKMRAHNLKMRQATSRVMALHEESLQNVQPIKALNLTRVFYRKILDIQEEYRKTAMDYHRFSVWTAMFMSLMGLLVSYACLGWAAYRLWVGAISFGTMVLFLQLSSYLSGSFSALINLVPSAISATVAAQRLMNVLRLPREETPELPQAEQWLEAGEALAVEAEELCFHYRDGGTVMENLSLRVGAGEMVAIVGQSGSGKTTLFRLLLALLKPQKGHCRVLRGGQAMALSPSTRCLFSYVPQDSLMFSGTIAESLRLVRPEASDEELWQALRAACAEDFVRKLPKGLDSELKERGASLSGGQTQRLAIARALLSNAPILLLDEVTAALDLETEQRVLANLAKSYRGRTCLISTHRPSVLALCDRVYRFEDHRLVSVEKP